MRVMIFFSIGTDIHDKWWKSTYLKLLNKTGLVALS
jgi:hypothetical protein